MKTKSFLLLCASVSLWPIVFTGCSTWPKDSYIRGAEVTTPWGTTKAEVIATGAAAKNLSAEERASILAPKK